MSGRSPRPPRRRRSEEITRQLHAARARSLDHILAAREQEKKQQREREALLREQQRIINAALAAYFGAADAITAAEQECDATIAGLRDAISRARADLAAAVETHRAVQAAAAHQIHQAGSTVDAVAEVLALPRGKAAGLVAAGRRSAAVINETTSRNVGSGLGTVRKPGKHPAPDANPRASTSSVTRKTPAPQQLPGQPHDRVEVPPGGGAEPFSRPGRGTGGRAVAAGDGGAVPD